jgi:hypothetical protein
MSETFEEKLEELRKKHPGSLTEADRAFLMARRSYLQPHEWTAFGLTETQPAEAEPEEDELIPETEEGNEPPKPAKRSKAKAKTKDEPQE